MSWLAVDTVVADGYRAVTGVGSPVPGTAVDVRSARLRSIDRMVVSTEDAGDLTPSP
ncbi:hypothetical protein ACI789_17325 [Geodermatophilus sp. SYSU D00965]